MAETLSEMFRQNMQCEALLECFHGLKQLDRACYQELIDSEDPRTVDEIAAAVDRERSTVYRSVQRLLQTGLVQKEQVNYDDGDYYHVYYLSEPGKVSQEMQRLLNEWYAQIDQLIQKFEDTYGDQIEQPRQTE